MSAEELRHVVTTEIQSFLHGRKERGEVTLRMIKEYLLGAVGQEAFDEILAEHKNHLKSEAARLVQEHDQDQEDSEKEDTKEMERQEQRMRAKEQEQRKAKEHNREEEAKKKRGRASSSTCDGESSSTDSDDFEEDRIAKKKVKSDKKGGNRASAESSVEDFEEDRKIKKASKDAENLKPSNKKSKADKHKSREKGGKERKREVDQKKSKSDNKDQNAAKADSAELQRLKDLVKRCKLHIPPRCFQGNPDSCELEERVHKWFLAQGFKSVRPSKSEIANFKAAKALAAELEGIDTSNIVKGRRASRDDDSNDAEDEVPAKRHRFVACDSSEED